MTRNMQTGVIATLVFVLAIAFAIPAFAQDRQLSESDVAVPADTSQAIRGVIGDQIDAFVSRDHERAYSHAAPNIKNVFSTVDRFISMVQNGYPMVYSPAAHLFARSMMFNGQVHQEVIFTDQEGKQWQAVYTLRQLEDGSWKITGVKINPHQGAAV